MRKIHTTLLSTLIVLAAASSFAQEAQLLAVLRSEATFEQKSAACRQLSRIATKESVPTLAAMLGDAKLSHMARYALEPIRDPSAGDALREALGKLQGGPRLGVIGSLGARRDAKAVDALAALLKDADADTACASARALGNIGTPAAAKALEDALPAASAANQLAICEGLFRCAEAISAAGDAEKAKAIYDRLRGLDKAPSQIRAAALRGAIVVRGKDGAALMVEALRGSDRALAAAAVRAARELPAAEITDALAAELPKAAPARQGLLILALADRGDARALPAVLKALQSDDAQLRVLALGALKRVGNASCVPALIEAAVEGNAEVSRAALETIENLQDKAADEQIAARLAQAKGKTRLVLMALAARRHTAAAAGALWTAADDADPGVRAAALAALGAVIGPSDLPKLIARLASAKSDSEIDALGKALREACLRAPDRDAVAASLTAALPTAAGPLKATILETLNAAGGAKALGAVAAAAKSDDDALRAAAFRVLGQWASADAAPVLLELHGTVKENKFKVSAIRGYIRIARQFNMPAEQRAAMCRTALKTAQRDEDRRLVLEVLLRYPSDAMKAIGAEAAEIPALKDEAQLVLSGMDRRDVERAELGKALAQAGHKAVDLEIVKAEYGTAAQSKDVTEILRRHAKRYRVIFLPGALYNESFGGDPAPGNAKQLKIKYKIDGKEGEVSLNENATIVLPMPK